MKTGVISMAAGSSYIEFDKTKVICGVYGPRQSSSDYSDKAEVKCDIRFASFALKDKRKPFLPGNEETEISLRVREAIEVSILLEKFPKSIIEVNVIILEGNGNITGAAITASSIALADAGIVTYDFVTACSVSKFGNELLLDPSEEEEKQQTGSFQIAYMPTLKQITQLSQGGELSVSETVKALELCLSGCYLIHELIKKHFKKLLTKQSQKSLLLKQLELQEDQEEIAQPPSN
uniref:Uncharacterized protein n=1 Tax=Arcella intermedia TaxID=1963864 RepID=A0A6B2LG90_9EUKA